MSRLPRPSTRSEWVTLAQLRLRNILERRVAANIRQLEAKISEAGPADKRPQPHILQTALERFKQGGALRIISARHEPRSHDTQFYALRENYPEPARARVAQLMVPYRVFRMLTSTEDYCANALENIVRASFATDARYTFLGKLPKTAPLDAVYRFGTRLVGVEVKNVREWVYPMSGEIWVMIRKCLELDALPFLVARKLAYLTHAVFSRLGIMGFEMHRQVFSPEVAHYLTEIRHTDLLGYKDVIALPPHPYSHLERFVGATLPGHIDRYFGLWTAARSLLTEFAIDRDLGNPQMRDPQREEHYRDFGRQIFPSAYEWENHIGEPPDAFEDEY